MQIERLKSERFDGNASDLAASLGVSQSLVSRILSGKTGTSESVALAVANALGMDVNDLLGRKPSAPKALDQTPPAASPAPPPASDVRTTESARAAARQMVRAAFDGDRHTYDDGILAEDALVVGAPFVSGLDPTEYVRRLLDTAARYRERGQSVTAKDLHGAAWHSAFEESRELRAQLARQREFETRARAWLEANGIDPETMQPHRAPPLAPTRPTTPRPKSGAGHR